MQLTFEEQLSITKFHNIATRSVSKTTGIFVYIIKHINVVIQFIFTC